MGQEKNQVKSKLKQESGDEGERKGKRSNVTEN